MIFTLLQRVLKMSSKRVCLGKLAGTHGVKGLVKVQPFGDDPLLIFDISPLYTSETGSDTIALEYKNPQGKFYLAAIDGITNKEDAAALGKVQIWVDRDELPELDADEDGYYIEDLIGLDVIGEDGQKIGTVKAVENFGASDLLEIKPLSGQPFLIPFTDEFVPEVGETITIRDYEEFL